MAQEDNTQLGIGGEEVTAEKQPADQSTETANPESQGTTTSPAQPGQGGQPGQNGQNGPFVSASLYVGDLHADVTEVMLLEVFNEVGPVASIRVCRDAVTRRSLGYAYVNFHNFVDAERAINIKNYAPVRGKPIRIMWSHRDPALRKSGQGNIFIKNLHKDIDNKALFDTFSVFGNILSCKVAIDQPTGQSKGFGFIHFETREAADKAIQKVNGKSIMEKVVTVCHFQSRQERFSGTGESGPRFTNVYIKNLDKDTDEEKLTAKCGEYGSITSLTIMKKPDGESRGFGFVNFGTPEEAAACVEGMNEFCFEGSEKKLFAGRAQKKSERSQELKKRFDTIRNERLQKWQGVNLFIKNLEDTITDESLREAFAQFGNITSARVMVEEQTDGEEKKSVSRGFGFVCFATPEEATRAVTEMNGRMLGNKPIYVALAQRKDARRAQLEAIAQRQTFAGNQMRMQRIDQPGPQQIGGPPMGYPQAVPQGYMPHPGAFPGQRQMMYNPQQMQAMRGWRPGMPRPMGPMMPGPYGMPGQGRGRQSRNRGQGQQGGQPVKIQPGGRGGRQNFKYNQQARNQEGQQQTPVPVAGGNQTPQQQQVQQQPQQVPPNDPNTPLSPAILAGMPEAQQKQILGERLYPLIQQKQPQGNLAGKITGMLLEMDNSELMHLIEDNDSLSQKIEEALMVLQEHSQNADGTPTE